MVRIFLHWRRHRFYAAGRSETRASRAFLPFSRSVSASTRSIEWYQHGLGACEVVESATNQYKEESNSIARFLDDCCDTDNSELTISSSALFDAYKRYCNENRLDSENIKVFKTSLESRGFAVRRTKAGVIWTGIDLADTFEPFAELKPDNPIPVDENWREFSALAA